MDAAPAPDPPADRRWLVAVLCAHWCGVCRDYGATFDSLAARFAPQAGFVWVDIEDQADALGTLEVDDFPTVLIADGDRPLFLGPVTPQPATLERLLRSALDGGLQPLDDEAASTLVPVVRAMGRAGRPPDPG